MDYIIAWVRSWFGVSQVSRQLAVLQRRIDRLTAEQAAADVEIISRLKWIETTRRTFLDQASKMEAEIETYKLLNKRLNAELVFVQEALKAKDEIIIPGLVSACETLHSRWEADVAVSAMRKIAATADRAE